MSKLLNIDLVKENKEAFEKKVIQVSDSLGINPNWLMQVMKFESGLNHRAVNPHTGATGLIQFMPNTADSLGTDIDSLSKMSNVDQLDYVYRYLQPYKGKMKNFVDTYLSVFFPAAVGKPPEYVIETKNISPEKIAKQNPVFDLNTDKRVTVKEITDSMLKRVPKEYWEEFKSFVEKKKA